LTSPKTRSISEQILLRQYVTDQGRILPRKYTGMPAHYQRRLTNAISARARCADEVNNSHFYFSGGSLAAAFFISKFCERFAMNLINEMPVQFDEMKTHAHHTRRQKCPR